MLSFETVVQDSKLKLAMLNDKCTTMLEDRTVTVVLGTDFTNISYTNFCALKDEVAPFWSSQLATYIRCVC